MNLLFKKYLNILNIQLMLEYSMPENIFIQIWITLQ